MITDNDIRRAFVQAYLDNNCELEEVDSEMIAAVRKVLELQSRLTEVGLAEKD